MIGYDEYINEMKRSGEAQPDYGRLRAALEQRLAGRRTAARQWRFRAALAGVCALLFVSLTAYFTYPLWQGGDQLMSYVYGQPEISDGPVIDYVFSD